MKSTPKYMKIYLDIKDKIIKNEYKIGEKLPTRKELADNYKTSKLTVKKGLDMLVSEGILNSRSGYGTEVLRLPIRNSKIFGPNEGLLNIVGEEHVQSKIHSFSIELPSKDIAKKLDISKNDYIYNIIRTRFIDHQPYSVEQTYMPLKTIPGLEPKILEKSVYSYIQDTLNLEIKESHIRIKGVLATKFESKLLSIEENSFMIEVEKVVSLSSGEPFEYSITKHLYEDFVYEAVFVNK